MKILISYPEAQKLSHNLFCDLLVLETVFLNKVLSKNYFLDCSWLFIRLLD